MVVIILQEWYNKTPKGKPLQLTINFLFPEVSELKRQIAFVLALVLCILPLASCESRKTKRESSSDATYELNEDLLSEIGMSKEQLSGKYGPQIGNDYGGSEYYKGYGFYKFDGDICTSIEGFYCETLFKNDIEGIQPEEVAQQYGLKYLLSRGEVDMVQSYYLIDGVVISITTTPSSLEGIYSTNRIATIDQFNVIEYQGLYFNPKGIDSRYQVFGEVAIGVPEDATIEDFLNDPLAQAISDAWLSDSWGNKKITFFGDEGEVTSGKLIPGMWIYAGNARFSVISYVEELGNE